MIGLSCPLYYGYHVFGISRPDHLRHHLMVGVAPGVGGHPFQSAGLVRSCNRDIVPGMVGVAPIPGVPQRCQSLLSFLNSLTWITWISHTTILIAPDPASAGRKTIGGSACQSQASHL